MQESTAQPLIPSWIEAYRAEVEPSSTEIQRLALSHAWAALEELWESPVRARELIDLQARGLPLLESIREGVNVDESIGAFVALARSA